ncbi:Malonamoyl-CoA synthetase [Lachnellula occidentalis]|uniref:Malonamoyl-CoA synthetase n=1 Tax=Lachnellula occidentalis TaxID=215460 RepID=A0A8H8RVV0_9HELO|nr:Malonamoyl-CoA synthetase [Lachnellula occidentalis]
MTESKEPVELWRHSSPQTTQMWFFKERVEKKYGVKLDGYRDLHKWSIENIEPFWRETCLFTGVHAKKAGSKGLVDASFDQILEKDAPMFPRPDFFPGTELNFAQNLLYPLHPESQDPVKDQDIAIIAATETSRSEVTWAELRKRVGECYNALQHQGVKPLDRVAGFVGNHTNAIVAMLATTALGAIWTAVSPDTGVGAVLDRLVQIEPVVLFADNASFYNGKIHETSAKIKEIIASLPKLQALVIFEEVSAIKMKEHIGDLKSPTGSSYTYQEPPTQDTSITQNRFTLFPPSHPVYILYSSGTTGKPKCIVHSSFGTLIQHKKEHILHCDIRPHDRLFYFTTTTWMMWHWLVSGLASAATIILYDGSPFAPHGPLTMSLLIDSLSITHFGTSAKYLSLLEQQAIFPLNNNLTLNSLKAIYSTGSPLAPSTFQYVYAAFGPSINLGSITGGTDIISLFGAPSPLSPVYTGEIQQKGLGMSISAFSPSGVPLTDSSPGDLICARPFPSQPVSFFGPTGMGKYRESYFEVFPGVWHHGDFVRFNERTGGMVMLGRSDGILKPSGVRFGSAEIYNILLKFFAADVEDALCIGRRREGDDDEVVVLFLKMGEGKTLDEGLRAGIRTCVRRELSARHVPGVIEECVEIPITTNGKKVEVAVKQILCGMNVKTSASVANSECLDWYREWAAKN